VKVFEMEFERLGLLKMEISLFVATLAEKA
jgi:hypothetical protein